MTTRSNTWIAMGAACFLSLAMSAAPSSADIVSIFADTANSTEGLGDFTGTVEYIATTATLTITLTNTSPPANGGFITGFAFNIDSSDPSATATLTSSSHPAMIGFTNQSAAPFGMFAAGAATGGNWEGGGMPSGGIAVNATGTFVFDVFASDAALLSAVSFVLAGPNQFGFVVRFHGFDDRGSDKVPAIIPAPGALALLLAGGLVSVRRRRNE